MSLHEGLTYKNEYTFDGFMKAIKNIPECYKETYDRPDVEHWKANWQRGYCWGSVTYVDENTLCSSQDTLDSKDLLTYNCVDAFNNLENNSYTNGFGFRVRRLQKSETYYKMGARLATAGQSVHPIFDVYKDQMLMGFLGYPSSTYNEVPLDFKGVVFRNYSRSTAYNPQDLSLCYTPESNWNEPVNISSAGNYYLRFSSYLWFKQVPNWIVQPTLFLKDNLRRVAAKILSDRVDTQRHLYLVITHKKEEPQKRVVLMSHRGKRLAQISLKQREIIRVNDILSSHNGYTENTYMTWYHLPIVSPLKSAAFSARVEQNLDLISL